MSKIELLAKIELLNKYEAMIAEMKNEADAVRDAIKAEMLAQDAEEMIVGQYIVRWNAVLSNVSVRRDSPFRVRQKSPI